MVITVNFVLVIGWKDLFFIQNITKENCVGSMNSFNARSVHFKNFLHLYNFVCFFSLNILFNVTVSAIKICSLKTFETAIQ